MSDEPNAPGPPNPPDPVPLANARVGAREVVLGAIVFVAALVLLVGSTRVFERGAIAARPSPSMVTVDRSPSLAPVRSASPVPSELPGDPVLVGAGDIGDCTSSGDEETATLLDGIGGTVFTAGDNAYESGTAEQFRDCYDASWGRHRERTRPAPGNHDWETDALAGYFGYFGQAAQGPDGSSWYSYDLGTWHIIVLDSTCSKVGGCGPASPQGVWLAADLAASDAICTLVIFHHPRFSSGEHGNLPAMDAFWRPLYAAGVEVIVNGHDHDYERFAPQDADGREDKERGIRQFVVGTGGARPRGFQRIAANSELRLSNARGVLAVTLHDGSYDAEFTAAGNDFRDRGTGTCH